MLDNSDNGDSWKTEIDDTHRFGRGDCPHAQRKIVLVDKPVCSCEIYKDATTARVGDSRSGHEIRYVGPATESVSNEEDYRSVAQIFCGSTSEGNNRPVIDAGDDDRRNFNLRSFVDLSLAEKKHDATTNDRSIGDPVNAPAQNTYRCYASSLTDTALSSSESLTARSSTDASSRTTARVERRCKIVNVSANDESKRDKYVQNNRQIVRISASSPSVGSSVGDNQISNGPDLRKRIAHSEWVRRKREIAQRRKEDEERAARKRREEDEKLAREKEERARLEKENFLKWIERKKQEELNRKAMLENELELQKRLKEIEDKAAIAKVLNLRQWIRKKEEEQKARNKEREMKQKKINEEREKRLQESLKAYEKWKENSKNKPKPATQGLLQGETGVRKSDSVATDSGKSFR
ncbi:protein PXR1 isoform X2 [Pseudomyrmex gracilis]|uniref:protein PXR1 isoform X2 n=1 Tax=Pseudomyrmex gracilis TaxID=219809 RepID=UPI000994E520|nr:protein PXR1 isoform X2 [Pseudomyrmex gracilis]